MDNAGSASLIALLVQVRQTVVNVKTTRTYIWTLAGCHANRALTSTQLQISVWIVVLFALFAMLMAAPNVRAPIFCTIKYVIWNAQQGYLKLLIHANFARVPACFAL